MIYLLRHALAVLVLPITVVVVVPAWIGRNNATAVAWPGTWSGWVSLASGVAFLALGGLLFVSSLRGFWSRGRGTLAPWDPPTTLVIQGPYAYVRNPMISGVILLLIGEATALRSLPHAEWAAAFFVLNALYIPILEEPLLRRRFGSEYEEYSRNVPRLIPRSSPWRGA